MALKEVPDVDELPEPPEETYQACDNFELSGPTEAYNRYMKIHCLNLALLTRDIFSVCVCVCVCVCCVCCVCGVFVVCGVCMHGVCVCVWGGGHVYMIHACVLCE